MDTKLYMPRPIFDSMDKEKSAFIRNCMYSRFSELTSSEIRDLAVVWSYYSGKIEGNTYSYVETETLLLDDISATKRYEDAVMLKNLYNAFISVTESIKKEGALPLDRRTLLGIHSMITDKLLPTDRRGSLRTLPVRISGTSYAPPADEEIIRATFEAVLQGQHEYTDPLERAVYLHCNLTRLQPFTDGNKRTARLAESITLMNGNVVPVYSSDAADIAAYRKGLIHYYETGDYAPYATYFLDRQLNRVMRMLPEKDQATRREIAGLLGTENT